jgi:hypothetical protein
MSLDWHLKPGCCALGAVIVLAASAALANDFAEQTPVQLAADSPETVTQASARGRGPPRRSTGTRRTASLYLAHAHDLQL